MRSVIVALKDKMCVMATCFSQHENMAKVPQVLLEKPLAGIVGVMIYYDRRVI